MKHKSMNIRRTAVILMAFAFAMTAKATFVKVHVEESGTLEEVLNRSGIHPDQIDSLSVSGFIDGDDIRLIEWLSGSSLTANEPCRDTGEGILEYLDLSDAKIMYGGMAYMSDCPVFLPGWIEELSTPYARKAEIGLFMFCGCRQLKEILLPKSTSAIRERSFTSCTGLRAMTVYSPDPLTCGVSEDIRHDCIVYVPDGCKYKYQQSDSWNGFKDIREMNERTEIVGVSTDRKSGANYLYNLSGQKVGYSSRPTAKGVYFVNSRKYLIK